MRWHPSGSRSTTNARAIPIEALLEALTIVKPEAKNPMDLSTLECASFAARHTEFMRTDPESATTIMMWLFGFSVARSGSHIFDADALGAFQTGLLADCAKHPGITLLDALSPAKTKKPQGNRRTGASRNYSIRARPDPRSRSFAP